MRKIFNKKNNQKGMTLVEMIMVVSIFMVISTIVLFNYGKFESSISLQNLADDIALSIREAQSYAIGARGIPNSTNPDSFFRGYGIHFMDSPSSNSFIGGSSKSFVIFVDVDNGGDYDYQSNEVTCGVNLILNNECYKVINISSADYISKVEGFNNGTLETLPSGAGYDIVFNRPYPEPSFCLKKQNENNCSFNQYTKVIITIKNPRTDKNKTVEITNTGQIVVR